MSVRPFRDFKSRAWAEAAGLAAAAALSAFLLFSNLRGVIYLSEDEARPFVLLSSGQLLYLIGRPVFDVFRTQESVFYLVAALNFLSLFVFYALARRAFGRGAALLAALAYAVFPLRIEYARLLYPAGFMELFFVSALYFAYRAVEEDRPVWMIPAGAFTALAFFAHYMAYALAAGLAFACVLVWTGKRTAPSRCAVHVARAALGFAAVLGALYAVLKVFHHYDFFEAFVNFRHDSPYYQEKGQAAGYLAGIVSHTLHSPFELAMALAVSISAVFGAREIFCRGRGAFFAGVLFAAGTLLVVSAVGGQHLLYGRHWPWAASLLSLGFGAGAVRLGAKLSLRARAAALAVFALWAAAAFYQSLGIVRQTFHITEINAWLRAHDVSRGEILTSWKLREKSETGDMRPLPVYSPEKISTENPSWLKTARLRIAWPAVYEAYRRAGARYVITSGLDELRCGTGQDDDPLLKGVEPLASWPHPYSSMESRSFYRPGTHYTIRVYRLSDVFSPENYRRLREAGRAR